MKTGLITHGAAVEQRSDIELKKLKQSCEDFESFLTSFVFKSMRETVSQDDSGDGGQAKGMYEEMMDQSVARQMSRDPGLGLARTLYQQLVPLLKDHGSVLKAEASPSDNTTAGEEVVSLDEVVK